MGRGLRNSIFAAVLLAPSVAADVQMDRARFIGKLTNASVFHKLERPGRLCHLWVGPKFADLPFDQKERFVNVVYAFCVAQRPEEKLVVLKDFRTGKDIGTYSEARGGLKLD